jgi:hypothetical protein
MLRSLGQAAFEFAGVVLIFMLFIGYWTVTP